MTNRPAAKAWTSIDLEEMLDYSAMAKFQEDKAESKLRRQLDDNDDRTVHHRHYTDTNLMRLSTCAYVLADTATVVA